MIIKYTYQGIGKDKAHSIFYIFSQETSKGPNFLSCFDVFSNFKMVMMRSGGSGRRRLVKGSSNSKGKTFNKKGSAIDPIDVEPLSSALPTLVPYGIFLDKGFG